MEIKKGKNIRSKGYRIYGCHFTKEEYVFIKKRLKKLCKTDGLRMSNTEVLLGLFKLALQEEKEEKGRIYRLFFPDYNGRSYLSCRCIKQSFLLEDRRSRCYGSDTGY